jgi:hypothetical protein
MVNPFKGILPDQVGDEKDMELQETVPALL